MDNSAHERGRSWGNVLGPFTSRASEQPHASVLAETGVTPRLEPHHSAGGMQRTPGMRGVSLEALGL